MQEKQSTKLSASANKYQYYNKYCDNYSSVSIEIICYFFNKKNTKHFFKWDF